MNPIKQSRRSRTISKRPADANRSGWWLAAVVALGAILAAVALSTAGAVVAEAEPIPAINDAQQQSAGINNLENLISDFLEDAGSRLKKSKANSMRQIKQTLRFGRRSDPMMSGAALLEQLALENELENQQRLQQHLNY